MEPNQGNSANPLLINIKEAKISLRPSKRRKIRKTKVFLEGRLTINNVEEFVQQVTNIFDDYEYVDFYLQNVEALDLSYIQSLFQLKSYYETQGKTVTIDSELPADIKKIIVQAGFEELVSVPKLV